MDFRCTASGGILGTKRSGDLQTQIDALQPFLSEARISYEHFKVLVQRAGVSLFDEDGRMIPDALQRFASGLDAGLGARQALPLSTATVLHGADILPCRCRTSILENP